MVVDLRKFVKSILFVSITFLLTGLFLTYEKDIIQIFNEKVIHKHSKIIVNYNDYYRPYNYKYIQNTKNFLASNEEDLYNIIYTAINSGSDSFEFYCKYEYKDCVEDITRIASDRNLLSNINNFTHPYNSFKQIETKLETFRKVSLSFTLTLTLQTAIFLTLFLVVNTSFSFTVFQKTSSSESDNSFTLLIV